MEASLFSAKVVSC